MDDTTRTDLLHPVLLDYINEVGDLKDSDTGPYVYDPEYKSPPKGQGDEPLFENGKLDDVESLDRSKFAERLANLQVKSKLTYTSIRDRLFKWLMKRDDMTVHLAALHARSAARGFLLNAVGTDLLVTASIRQWRQLVEDNERPDADAGMQVLAGEVKQVLAL
jgi:thymidylate synthase ThyX